MKRESLEVKGEGFVLGVQLREAFVSPLTLVALPGPAEEAGTISTLQSPPKLPTLTAARGREFVEHGEHESLRIHRHEAELAPTGLDDRLGGERIQFLRRNRSPVVKAVSVGNVVDNAVKKRAHGAGELLRVAVLLGDEEDVVEERVA